MDTIALVLLCLALVSHGRVLQFRSEHADDNAYAALQFTQKAMRASQAKSLSTLLLAFNAAPGWQLQDARRARMLGMTRTRHTNHKNIFMMASKSPLKVLCLQPKGGTGNSFLARLEAIRQAAGDGLEWDAIDAPQVLDGPEELQWWINPPGQRSYTATAYEGDDIAIKKVEDTWINQGPYDVILGFSQGAMLAAIVIARGALGQGDVRPRGAVLMGAATPKPYEELMSKFKECADEPLSLHCLSREDTINPPEMGEWIASCFGSKAEIHWHGSGHVTPGDKGDKDSAAIAAVADFLTGMASK